MRLISKLISVILFASLIATAWAGSYGVPNLPSRTYTQSGDRRIFVQKRKQDCSLSQPYALVIKGINWAPASVGTDPASNPLGYRQEFFNWYSNDIPMMAKMGINTVRLYHDMGTNSQAQAVLDMFYRYGIWVIMPVDSPYANSVANSNNVVAVVSALKYHPAILGFAVGNEWDINYYYNTFTNLRTSAGFTEWAAETIKFMDTNHVAMSFYGDPHIPLGDNPTYHYLDPQIAPWQPTDGSINFTSTVVSNWAPSVDVWALQLYRGWTFTDALSQWAQISMKPLIVGEYGADSYSHTTAGENQLVQATFDQGLWDQSVFDLSPERTNGILSGLLGFEWNDEWWKNGSPSTHNISSEINGGQPDGYNDEEWFGFVDISRHPKTVYTNLQSRFQLNGQQGIPLATNPVLAATSGNLAIFTVNGKTFYARGGGNEGARGFNIAILDARTGIRIKEFQHFDTWYYQGNAAYLQSVANYLNGIAEGSVVMLAIADNSGLFPQWNTQNQPVYAALEAMGSTQIRTAPATNWAMITQKGVGKLAETSSASTITATLSLAIDPNYGRRQIPPTAQAAVITGIRQTAGDVTMTFQSQDGFVYQIDYRNNVWAGDWQVAQRGVIADGVSTSWTDDGSFTGILSGQRFYRVAVIDVVNR